MLSSCARKSDVMYVQLQAAASSVSCASAAPQRQLQTHQCRTFMNAATIASRSRRGTSTCSSTCLCHTRDNLLKQARRWQATSTATATATATPASVSSAPQPSVRAAAPAPSSPTKMRDMVESASELLPNQNIILNFIHRNPFRDIQNKQYDEALQYVTQVESYPTIGARVMKATGGVDPRKRAYEAVVELAAAFVDRGAAKWNAPFRQRGFLYFAAQLEGLASPKWRKYVRDTASYILFTMDADDSLSQQQRDEKYASLCEAILADNLSHFGCKNDNERAMMLRTMMLELKGYAGMFKRMEGFPHERPDNVPVRLVEFLTVQSMMLRASCDEMAQSKAAVAWQPREQSFAAWIAQQVPLTDDYLHAHLHHHHDHTHSSANSCYEQDKHRKDTEKEYEDALFKAIALREQTTPLAPLPSASSKTSTPSPVPTAYVSPVPTRPRPSIQMWGCMDDRIESIRRHIERLSNNEAETFGVAGYFGLSVDYKALNTTTSDILAPDNFKAELEATEVVRPGADDTKHERRRQLIARARVGYEYASASPVGSLVLSALAPLSVVRLATMGLFPKQYASVKAKVNQWAQAAKPPTTIHSPITLTKAALLLFQSFQEVGTLTPDRFAPIVVLMGHGSSSANNPFAHAYNCGACAGRHGGPNARLMAQFANDPQIRALLKKNHAVTIPDDTWFVGASHDTTSDAIEFHDTDLVPASHRQRCEDALKLCQRAAGENALERCMRFMSAREVRTPDEALAHVSMRSLDPTEVRPELNHATNCAVIIGRRSMTENVFLDRRAFLASYDHFADDEQGTALERIVGPGLKISSGISLEYFFSTIESDTHGPGTKAPLNVVGNIGVMQGATGDLRPGLPTQMTEMHTPIRSTFVMDTTTARIDAIVQRRPDLVNIVVNDWVRMVVRDPFTGQWYRHVRGTWQPIAIPALAEASRKLQLLPNKQPTETALAQASKQIQEIGQRSLLSARVAIGKEDVIYRATQLGLAAAYALPLYMYAGAAMNPMGALIATAGTTLAVPVWGVARRYMHGEHMFARFGALSTAMLLAFNMVAMAPTLESALLAWSLFGFSSTFLIGAYNERPSVHDNSSFAFGVYKLSDYALLSAATLAAAAGAAGPAAASTGVAMCLVAAALLKSSQFPLARLFARSMEGPTPTSALGYAGLSAHVGLVLLASTLELWFPSMLARSVLAGVGAYTAAHSSLVAKVRADRKGALGYATSATIGLLYVLMAAGLPNLALALGFGHAAFRMLQVLRAPAAITDHNELIRMLNKQPWTETVAAWKYKLAWRFSRFDTEFQPTTILSSLFAKLRLPATTVKFTKLQQWALTALAVVLAGLPFTPFSHWLEHEISHLLGTNVPAALAVMIVNLVASVLVVRSLFVNTLALKYRFPRAARPELVAAPAATTAAAAATRAIQQGAAAAKQTATAAANAGRTTAAAAPARAIHSKQ